jgi:hypothetical protein
MAEADLGGGSGGIASGFDHDDDDLPKKVDKSKKK